MTIRRTRPQWYRALLAWAKTQQCHYCGDPATTLDHVIELQEGGAHHPSNLVPACQPCNSRKGRATQIRVAGGGRPRMRPPRSPKAWTR